MDVLVRIKRLIVARRVRFTTKATEERERDGLTVEDVLESILNVNAIKKVPLAIAAAASISGTPVRHREPDIHGHLGVFEGHLPAAAG